MSGGGGVGDSGRASAEQRDRMLMQNERLQSQNSTIRNAIEMAEETEGVAMEISQELGRHREKIKVRRAKGGGACRRRANARERDAATRARYRAAERDMARARATVDPRARTRDERHGRTREEVARADESARGAAEDHPRRSRAHVAGLCTAGPMRSLCDRRRAVHALVTAS